MKTTLSQNSWINVGERNGVTVQRKFAGVHATISEDDTVIDCHIDYFIRELYPNGEAIKTEKKKYCLVDLDDFNKEDEGWKMEALLVLTGFINSMGNQYIIGPARETLADVNILPLDAPDGYWLREATRPRVEIPTTEQEG